MKLSEFTFEGGREVGACTIGNKKYHLRTGTFKGEQIMAVISVKTRKSFLVQWGDLIDLAIAAGIDETKEAA